MTPDIPGYRIIRKLGAGGMATVWLAEQTKFERQVALKVMSPALGADPSFRERFVREAKIVARLSHPHIVAVHDVGEHAGHVYMAMEYHTGGDLKARIRAGVTPVEAARVVSEIARALALAHEKGVIHRDIKPDNILFRGDGSAVLTDFGIAKQGDTKTQFTQTGMVVGTPKYMSPEQARGHPLQPESDLYALGVLFYEALTGSAPFQAEDSIALAIKHIKDPPPPLPSPLKRLQPFVSRLMAKSPSDRFHSGTEVAEALEQIVASGALKGLPATPGAGGGEAATRQSSAISGPRGLSVNVERKDMARYGLVAAGLVLVGGTAAWFLFGSVEDATVPADVGVADVAVEEPVAPEEPAASTDVVPEGPEDATLPEEPAAVAETPPPAPQPPAPVVPATPPAKPAVDVRGLLGSAETALSEGRLAAPPGDNALEYYRKVLAAEPRNKAASAGLRRIADRLVERIDAALARGDRSQASDYLRIAERVVPNYGPVADAATRIVSGASTEAGPAGLSSAGGAAPSREEGVAAPGGGGADASAIRNRMRAKGMAERGQTLLRQGDKAGARQQFEQALALDPVNAVAKEGLAGLGAP